MFRIEFTKQVARDSSQAPIGFEIASCTVEGTTTDLHDSDVEERSYGSYGSIYKMYEFDLKHFPLYVRW
jgi:hypothetical protein